MWAYELYFYYNVSMTILMVLSTTIRIWGYYEPTLRYSTNSEVIGQAVGAIVSGTLTTALASGSLAILMIKTLSVMLGVFIGNGLWDVVA